MSPGRQHLFLGEACVPHLNLPKKYYIFINRYNPLGLTLCIFSNCWWSTSDWCHIIYASKFVGDPTTSKSSHLWYTCLVIDQTVSITSAALTFLISLWHNDTGKLSCKHMDLYEIHCALKYPERYRPPRVLSKCPGVNALFTESNK